MAITVYRSSTRQFGSALGEQITEKADTGVTLEDHIGIYFPTRQSQFIVLINPSSFATMAENMMAADPDAAIKAFGAAMAKGIKKPLKRK